MSNDLVSNWNDRFDYAREVERRGPLQPTEDHLRALRAAAWSWNDCEFGAASMDPKRPYGNSDVLDDLAELLPHLSEAERVRVHCELPAVLAWIVANLPAVSP
jgi:hypothetical protein